MHMWRTKDQDARGGKTIPANFACDVMLDKILGLSDFTIVAAGPIPILEPALNRKLRNRSFGHVRLVAIAGALVVHCQERTSLTLQSQAMRPSWSGAWRNANSTNSASTTSITTLRCWFYALPPSRLMLLCKNRRRREKMTNRAPTAFLEYNLAPSPLLYLCDSVSAEDGFRVGELDTMMRSQKDLELSH
jgi:hypothetical protein